MGVKDLWKILEPVKQHVPLHELRGLTLAVDLSLWVCESEGVSEMRGRVTKPYLRNLFFRVSHLTQLGVQLVFVVDGVAPELKLEEMQRRLQLRNPQRKKTTKCSSISRTRPHFQALINQCCEMLDYMGITYKRSHGEAEAFAALMNQKGIVDGCITNDGDAFLYGAKTVYKNFTMNREDRHVEKYTTADIESTLKLNRDKLVALGLFLGCDFLPKGVPGVGHTTALKYLEEVEDNFILARLRLWHSPRFIDSSKVEEQIRKKAMKCTDFPNKKVIDEFTVAKDRVPYSPLKAKRPRLFALQRFMHKEMEWEEEYGFEKVIPLVTLFDLRTVKRNPHHRHSPNCLRPNKIVKTRVKQGVSMFEVLWYKMGKDDFTTTDYYTTIEEQELFTSCFSDVVETFEEEQKAKGKKPRKKEANKEEPQEAAGVNEHGSTENVAMVAKSYDNTKTANKGRKKNRVAVSLQDEFEENESNKDAPTSLHDSLAELMLSDNDKIQSGIDENNMPRKTSNLHNKENILASKASSKGGTKTVTNAKTSSSLNVKKSQSSISNRILSVRKKANGIEAVLGEIENVKSSLNSRGNQNNGDNSSESSDDDVANQSFLPLSQRLIIRASQKSTESKASNKSQGYRKSVVLLSSSDEEDDDNVFTSSQGASNKQNKATYSGRTKGLNNCLTQKVSQMSISESVTDVTPFETLGNKLQEISTDGIKSKVHQPSKKLSIIDLDDSLFADELPVMSKNSNAKISDTDNNKHVSKNTKMSVIEIDSSDAELEKQCRKLDQLDKTEKELARKSVLTKQGDYRTKTKKASVIAVDDSDSDIEEFKNSSKLELNNNLCKQKLSKSITDNPFMDESELPLLNPEKSKTTNPFMDQSELSLLIMEKTNTKALNPFMDDSEITLLNHEKGQKLNLTNPFVDDSDIEYQILKSKSNICGLPDNGDDTDVSMFEVANSVITDMSTLSICESPNIHSILPGKVHNEPVCGTVVTNNKESQVETDVTSDQNKSLVSKLFCNVSIDNIEENNNSSQSDSMEQRNTSSSSGSDKGNFSLGVTLNMTSSFSHGAIEVSPPMSNDVKSMKSTPDQTIIISNEPENFLSIEKVRKHQKDQSVLSLDRTEVFQVESFDKNRSKKFRAISRSDESSPDADMTLYETAIDDMDGTLFVNNYNGNETVIEIAAMPRFTGLNISDNSNELKSNSDLTQLSSDRQIFTQPQDLLSDSNKTLIYSTQNISSPDANVTVMFAKPKNLMPDFNCSSVFGKQSHKTPNSDDTLVVTNRCDIMTTDSNDNVIIAKPGLKSDVNETVSCVDETVLCEDTTLFLSKRKESPFLNDTVRQSHECVDDTVLVSHPYSKESSLCNGTLLVSGKTDSFNCNSNIETNSPEHTLCFENSVLLENNAMSQSNYSLTGNSAEKTVLFPNQTGATKANSDETIFFAKPASKQSGADETILFPTDSNYYKRLILGQDDYSSVKNDSVTKERTKALFAKPRALMIGKDKSKSGSKLDQQTSVLCAENLNNSSKFDETLGSLAIDSTLIVSQPLNCEQDKTLLLENIPNFIPGMECTPLSGDKTISETLFRKPKQMNKNIIISGLEFFSDCNSPPTKRNKPDTLELKNNKCNESYSGSNVDVLTCEANGDADSHEVDNEKQVVNDVIILSTSPACNNSSQKGKKLPMLDTNCKSNNSDEVIVISPLSPKGISFIDVESTMEHSHISKVTSKPCKKLNLRKSPENLTTGFPIALRTRKSKGKNPTQSSVYITNSKTADTVDKVMEKTRRSSVYICDIIQKVKTPKVKRLLSTTPIALRTRRKDNTKDPIEISGSRRNNKGNTRNRPITVVNRDSFDKTCAKKITRSAANKDNSISKRKEVNSSDIVVLKVVNSNVNRANVGNSDRQKVSMKRSETVVTRSRKALSKDKENIQMYETKSSRTRSRNARV